MIEETAMKVTREQAAENRERILDAAAQLFRERGFEGIGVADLMKEAGLTHGGFGIDIDAGAGDCRKRVVD